MGNDINEMIERVIIQRNKTVDDMILGEIRKIATENGIDTIITLNDKAIIQALKNFAEVKHGEWKHECLECSICKRNISEIYDADSYMASGIECELLFCPFCGAKMDGGKAE